MKSKPAQQNLLVKKSLAILWKSFPLIAVLLMIGLIILPLNQKISARKADLAQRQANQIKAAPAPTNVVTMEILPEMIMEKITLPGVAKPWISLQIVAEVRGKIISKKIEEGTRVEKGDVLAMIDHRDYQHNFASAQASHETAVTTEKRFKALSRKQFVTQSQLDDASARVKTTRAALDTARLNLERCTIRSPMAGVVDRVFVETGSFLSVGDPVAVILEIDRLKVEVGIPESDVAAVRQLKTFDMTIDALGGKSYSGNYHYLFKTTDSMARLYNLEIRLENPENIILPDMFARVSIVKNLDPQGLAVPIYSLVTKDNLTGVFVENDNIVAFRPVTTGFQDGWKIQVAKGLTPGDKVVVVGQRIVDQGEAVNVIRTIRTMEELAL